jgi:hypothetical protein
VRGGRPAADGGADLVQVRGGRPAADGEALHRPGSHARARRHTAPSSSTRPIRPPPRSPRPETTPNAGQTHPPTPGRSRCGTRPRSFGAIASEAARGPSAASGQVTRTPASDTDRRLWSACRRQRGVVRGRPEHAIEPAFGGTPPRWRLVSDMGHPVRAVTDRSEWHRSWNYATRRGAANRRARTPPGPLAAAGEGRCASCHIVAGQSAGMRTVKKLTRLLAAGGSRLARETTT